MNIEFAVGKLAGYFSYIGNIWTLQKSCFWVHPIQWEQTKPTATNCMVIQLLPPFVPGSCPYLRPGRHFTQISLVWSWDAVPKIKVWDQPVVCPFATHSSGAELGDFWWGLQTPGVSRWYLRCSGMELGIFMRFAGAWKLFRILCLYMTVQPFCVWMASCCFQSCVVLRGALSLHTTAREDLQAALEQLKPNRIGQNPRMENTPCGESTPNALSPHCAQ